MSVRSALFDSEVLATDFLSSIYNGTVSNNPKYPLIEGNILDPNDPESFNESMVVLRNYDLEKGFHLPLFGTKGKLLEVVFPGEKFYKSLEDSNKLYANGEVRICYIFDN